MKTEFLQNFKVGEQPLTKEIIDAILAENGRDRQSRQSRHAALSMWRLCQVDASIFAWTQNLVYRQKASRL